MIIIKAIIKKRSENCYFRGFVCVRSSSFSMLFLLNLSYGGQTWLIFEGADGCFFCIHQRWRITNMYVPERSYRAAHSFVYFLRLPLAVDLGNHHHKRILNHHNSADV